MDPAEIRIGHFGGDVVEAIRRDVGGDIALHRVEQRGKGHEEVAGGQLLGDCGKHLLLACGPGEVAVTGAETRAREGQRRRPVEVMRACGQVEAAMPVERVVVARIVDRALVHDVDAPDRVDDLAHPLDVDGRHVVDLHPEQGADRRLERCRSAERIRRRILVRELHQRVELGVEDATVAERHAIQVARDGEHRPAAGVRVEGGDEHRVGQLVRRGPVRSRCRRAAR